MNGVSTVAACELTEGDDRIVLDAGRVLTSLVVCERTGLAPAAIELCGVGRQGPYFQLRLPPNGAITFNDAIALPWGLLILCHTGEACVSVSYR